MVFEVFEENGSSLGLMYFDYFKRDKQIRWRLDEQFCSASPSF